MFVPLFMTRLLCQDMECYNSMKYILDNDPEPLCLTFSTNKELLGEVWTACSFPKCYWRVSVGERS